MIQLNKRLIKCMLLSGLYVLLTACAATSAIQAHDPNISLHPRPVAKQLQIALEMTAPNNPKQYINANAQVSAAGASATSTASTNTVNNDQVFQSYRNTTSNTAVNIKSDPAVYNAKVHVISVLRPQIENILSQYGFVPVAYQSQLQRKLTVQIVDLDDSSGLKATIEVDAINGMLTYSRTYTGSLSDISIGTMQERSTRLVGDLLTQALGDAQLISFLNQP